MRLVRLIANLGYGSRKEVAQMFRAGRVTDAGGEVLYADDQVEAASIRVDGTPLDPGSGLVLMLHKPMGTTCSHRDPGQLIYDLLPPRFARRRPPVSSIGRLDRDTSGLLLLTDDGALLHRVIAPVAQVRKRYVATLAQDLRGDEAAVFASGTLLLDGETTPLAPAPFQALGPREAQVTLTEGRYHQVRRMFAALGNRVETLHRAAIGDLVLGELPSGHWRQLQAAELALVFAR